MSKPIVPPGRYLSRGGFEVVVPEPPAGVTVSADSGVIGWILVPTVSGVEAVAELWGTDGRYYTGDAPSQRDIVGPLNTTDFKHWDKYPWAKAVYCEYGRWYATSEVPVADETTDDIRFEYSERHIATVHIKKAHYPVREVPLSLQVIPRPANL